MSILGFVKTLINYNWEVPIGDLAVRVLPLRSLRTRSRYGRGGV